MANQNRKARRNGGIAAAVAAAVLASALGGCSSVPDALNPAEWYKSTTDLFSGERKDKDAKAKPTAEQKAESQLVADRGKPPPDADKPFPSLSSVPAERPRPTPRAEREAIVEGLVADRESRRYSTEVIQRQGEGPAARAPAAPVPPRAPAPVIAAPPPAPARAPQVATAPQMPAPRPAAAAEAAAPPPAGVLEVYRAHLAQTRPSREALAETTAAAKAAANALPPPRPMPDSGATATGQGAVGTVVVSSAGIETGAAMQAPPAGVRPLMASSAVPRGSTKVATILFANGSTALSGRDRAIIGDVRRLYVERGGRMHVVGHASSRTRNMDPARHRMVNDDLSLRRANAVRDELVRLGVARDAVVVTARGDRDPVYYEIMESGEAGNRRTEIYIDN